MSQLKSTEGLSFALQASAYLEVIRRERIVLIQGLGEDDERISDVEMSDVVRQGLVET